MSSSDLDRAMQAVRAEQEKSRAEQLERTNDQLKTKERLRIAALDFAIRARAVGYEPKTIELRGWRQEKYGLFSQKTRTAVEVQHKLGWEIYDIDRDYEIYVFTDGTVQHGSHHWNEYLKQQHEGFSSLQEKQVLNAIARYLVKHGG